MHLGNLKLVAHGDRPAVPLLVLPGRLLNCHIRNDQQGRNFRTVALHIKISLLRSGNLAKIRFFDCVCSSRSTCGLIFMDGIKKNTLP